MKTEDVKKTLKTEIVRAEDELDRHLKHQNTETNRFDYQIDELKQEKTQLSAQLIALQRRISDLETNIGTEIVQGII